MNNMSGFNMPSVMSEQDGGKFKAGCDTCASGGKRAKIAKKTKKVKRRGGDETLHELSPSPVPSPMDGGKKRKLSEYNKFVKKQFTILKKEFPSKTAPQIMVLIGKKWKETKK